MAVGSLSIASLVRLSYGEVWRNWRSALLLGLVPSALGGLVIYSASFAFFDLSSQVPTWLNGAFALFVQAPIAAVIAVGWHRLILLGEYPTSLQPTWTPQHTKFWGWSILLLYVSAVPRNVLGSSLAPDLGDWGNFLMLSLYPAAAYVEARLFLVLPAAALAHRASLWRSWELSSGNGIRLAAAALLALVPAGAVLIVILLFLPPEYMAQEFHPFESAVTNLMVCVLGPALTCLEVGVLSHAYRRLLPLDTDELDPPAVQHAAAG